MKKWALNSWKKFPAKHIPEYQDQKELDLVLGKVKKYPPLVFAGETRSLKKAFPLTTFANAFFKERDSPANTNGGYFFTLPKTKSSSF